MTPEALARLHQKAFLTTRPWHAAEFESLLRSPHVYLFAREHGFALIRVVAGEAELLTLAVDPEHRRQGIASALMHDWMIASEAGSAFLEVAADNQPAIALYAGHGFEICGRRAGYYRRKDAEPVDALLMQIALTPRREADSST
jgi:ribosomal-protein-alanine N-acetyltransferase